VTAGFEPRRFPLFDPAGDGRVAEVFGGLTRAEHVAVTVPGVTDRLGDRPFPMSRGRP